MEKWKDFLQKPVKIIIDDNPSPYPKKKEGILQEINETHLIIKQDDKKPEAIRLSDVRRIELIEVNHPPQKFEVKDNLNEVNNNGC